MASLVETSKNAFDVSVALQYKHIVIHIVESFNVYINGSLAGVACAQTGPNDLAVPTDFRGQMTLSQRYQPITSVRMVPVMDTGEEEETSAFYLTPSGNGNGGGQNGGGTKDTGYVLCESLSVRESASGTASIVQKLGYGTTVRVLQKSGTWYHIEYMGKRGWIDGSYVLLNPRYYITGRQTPAYAYTSPGAKRVGLIDPDVKLAIIDEVNGYYVVSLRGACAFIKK